MSDRHELLGTDRASTQHGHDPQNITAPILAFINANADALVAKGILTADDVSDVGRGLSIPRDAFLKAVAYISQAHNTVANNNNIGKTLNVNPSSALVAEIIDTWRNANIKLPQAQLATMASLAAATALSFHRNAQQTEPHHVVDPISGLVLPPPARTPYQERARRSNGRRPNAFEHIRATYPDYMDAGLLFSGHVLDIDKPAYEAALYLAHKEVRERARARRNHYFCRCFHSPRTGCRLSPRISSRTPQTAG